MGEVIVSQQMSLPLGAVKLIVCAGTGPFFTKSLVPILRLFMLKVSILCLPGACAEMRARFIQQFQVQVFQGKGSQHGKKSKRGVGEGKGM